MPLHKHAIIEIDENAKLSEIPDIGTWKPGALDTNPRCFDLLCTGKVQINSNDYKLKLNVSAVNKIPNFFTKNSVGEIVFAEPKPMCTIKMPRGHWGTIIVRLKSVSTEQSNAKNYVCLGVKEDGEITDVLYGDGAYKYVDMTDESDVELVPLISTTMLSNKYTKAEVGAKVIFSNTAFDFGSVYRVTIDDEQKIEWSAPLAQSSEESLAKIANNSAWYIESNGVGVGSVKNKGMRMLAINNNTGKLASSTDGANWDDEGFINGDTSSGWITGPVYGNGIWCAISESGIVRYSTNKTETWLTSSQPPAVNNCCLAFGNGVFMSIGLDGDVYASNDANIWKVIGDVPYDSNNYDSTRILRYDSNSSKWMCIATCGDVYISKDNGRMWNPAIPDPEMEGDELHTINPNGNFSCCYAHGHFYAVKAAPKDGSIACSTNGKNWSLERVLGLGYLHNISFYNGKIYTFHSNGLTYSTGTFK